MIRILTLSLLLSTATFAQIQLKTALPDGTHIVSTVKGTKFISKRPGGSRIEASLDTTLGWKLVACDWSLGKQTTGPNKLKIVNTEIGFTHLSDLPPNLQCIVAILMQLEKLNWNNYRKNT